MQCSKQTAQWNSSNKIFWLVYNKSPQYKWNIFKTNINNGVNSVNFDCFHFWYFGSVVTCSYNRTNAPPHACALVAFPVSFLHNNDVFPILPFYSHDIFKFFLIVRCNVLDQNGACFKFMALFEPKTDCQSNYNLCAATCKILLFHSLIGAGKTVSNRLNSNSLKWGWKFPWHMRIEFK